MESLLIQGQDVEENKDTQIINNSQISPPTEKWHE